MKSNPSIAILALALLLSCLSTTGCGLFTTSEPDPPTGNIVVPPNFSTPESTLATLARSVRGRNSINYGQCFPDTLLDDRDFHASFDPADAAAFQQSGGVLPDDWNRDRELSFFPRFVTINTGAFYDVFFRQDPLRPDVSLGAEKLIQNRLYRVYAAGNPVVAGSAGLTFERVGAAGDWKITFWEDRRDTADARTWGAARLNPQ